MGRPRKFVDTPYAGDAGEVVQAAVEVDVSVVDRSLLPALLAAAKAKGDQPMIDAILARCRE